MEQVSLPFFIVGAGASGLAFALGCVKKGASVRIIDKRSERSNLAKATGVSQGAWKILEDLNVDLSSAVNAIPLRNFVFYDDDNLIANISVPSVNSRQPADFFPQLLVEKILESELNQRGVYVEYGTSLVSLDQRDTVKVTLAKENTNEVECFFAKWVIGADGANSWVRNHLNVPFVGRDYPEQWSVAEIETDQWDSSCQAKLYLSANGVGLFLSQSKLGAVQGIVNSPNAADLLLVQFPDAKISYSRKFTVSLRRVITPKVGNIWLIGDAAHVQSPVGGQGLNLALWDGAILADALLKDDLTVEKRLAKRAKLVLFFTDFDYRMLCSRNRLVRILRNSYWRLAARYPRVSLWFFKIIAGI